MGEASIRVPDQASWDAAHARLDGDLLQSWLWGEFKRHHGWKVERLHVVDADGEALAQVLFRRVGALSLAYLPRGPVMGDISAGAAALLQAVDELCARYRAITLIIEPHRLLPATWATAGQGFVPGPAPFQSARTVKVPLTGDATLLAQMRRDTRHNISHAMRHGVAVDQVPFSDQALATFYELLRESASRNGFGIHPPDYYADFVRTFGSQAVLFFSRVEDVITGGLIAAKAGAEGRSMYAGTAAAHRRRGDAALLRFEAMRWAREHGCVRFDLGGVAPVAAPAAFADQSSLPATARTGLQGVHHFKTGFGGDLITFPPPVERPYRPVIARLLKRLHPRFRTAPEPTMLEPA